ncbi:ROK family protein [Microbacterium sp. H1-D42]|uniref:ROK family protein n=1 Tax=Microbacterium sp. H1-D42 TaxID=2925844 RepID=UPI001F52D2A0|nr:ROK family protein [Microbacterium sp. H1-D42]UNK70012.1 ROK family protein [Microbacterium sp. H1-D42]
MRIGLDVGGTKIAGIARADDGTVLAHVRRATGSGGDAVLTGILDAAGELRAQLADPDLRSIGIGIPGLVDAEAGLVVHAVNLGVESLAIAEHVQRMLGVPCFVENDVKAAALGAAALRDDGAPIAYLNLGTGVAAGIIVDGRIWRGARGTAGEVGHFVVDPNGRLCGCGQRGCIETLCGGGALARAWGGAGELPVKDILDAADAGDDVAIALRDDLFRGAAAAVRALVLSVDVEVIVIGGGLTALTGRLEPGIHAALRADAAQSSFLRSLRLDERIEMLPADSPVAAVGAALLGSVPAKTIALDKEIIVHG